MRRLVGLGLVAALAALASEVRIARSVQPVSTGWQQMPVQPRGSTLVGLSFRPPQVDALGLDLHAALARLLDYPFQLLRLGAYWRRMEPRPGEFVPDELDWQLQAAEAAGKQVLLCVGGVKCFGYPEFFVPPWRLPRPIREGVVVGADDHAWLLEAALEFVSRIVERYRDSTAIVGWQIEHESVDPLGLEHSWRLGRDFVSAEIEAVRRLDPRGRPVLLNGFLPISNLVALQQWWRTRPEGDSLAFALEAADIVGFDVYPRNALFAAGPVTAYLDGGEGIGPRALRARLIARALRAGKRVMVSEGQAEPWETVVEPPNPRDGVMYSCSPEQILATYNAWLRSVPELDAYLFWGAEYWLARERSGDGTYLGTFARILEEGG